MDTFQEITTTAPEIGHTVVLGKSGSGKTAAACARAAYYAALPEHPGVLLLTWNRISAELLRQRFRRVQRPPKIMSYQDFAVQRMRQRKVLSGSCRILTPQKQQNYLRQALAYCRSHYPDEPMFQLPESFYAPQLYSFRQAAASAPDGADSSVPEKLRRCLEALYMKYLELRTFDGWHYDRDDLAEAFYRSAQTSRPEYRYAHIIVDQAEEFSPVMLQSLLTCLQSGGSFTMFADPAQQICSCRHAWQEAGIPVSRIRVLSEKCRASAEIDAFLSNILRRLDCRAPAAEECDHADRLAFRLFPTPSVEAEAIITQALQISRHEPTVILCRNGRMLERFREMLSCRRAGFTVLNTDSSTIPQHRTVYLSEYRDAKGLVFPHVFLPGLSAQAQAGAEDSRRAELRLLYAAASRAQKTLRLSGSGMPSPLLSPHCVCVTKC